jgi:3-hydroxymyristoyl/3-hydroxydecanoyl-(acyl carrier protein) dehydratase
LALGRLPAIVEFTEPGVVVFTRVAEFWDFGDHLAMALKPAQKKLGKDSLVQGKPITALGSGYMLVRVGAAKKRAAVRPGDQATVLVAKAWQALNKPGIDKQVVFRGSQNGKIFAYSVYPDDPSKVVREAADGTRRVGRLVDGKFRVAAKAA